MDTEGGVSTVQGLPGDEGKRTGFREKKRVSYFLDFNVLSIPQGHFRMNDMFLMKKVTKRSR